MQYIQYDDYEQAEERSRQVYDEARGKPKPPEDITAYQWRILQHSSLAYVLMAIDPGTEYMLNASEENLLLPESDPVVQDMLAAFATAVDPTRRS